MPASKAISSFDVYEGAAYDRKTNNTVMNNTKHRGGIDAQQQRHLITETNFFNTKELEANIKARPSRGAVGAEFPHIM